MWAALYPLLGPGGATMGATLPAKVSTWFAEVAGMAAVTAGVAAALNGAALEVRNASFYLSLSKRILASPSPSLRLATPLCYHMPIRRGSSGAVWFGRVRTALAARRVVPKEVSANVLFLTSVIHHPDAIFLTRTLTLLLSRRWRLRQKRRLRRRLGRRASCPRRARATCW